MNTTANTTANGTKSLSGKIALVTGGSRGIGAAIVERLRADGATVEFTSTSGKDGAIKADAADANAIRDAVATVVKKHDRIDILVNNAGMLSVGEIASVKDEDLDRMLAVNVRGVFLATQAAVAHMPKGGRVINIGSINSDSVPFPGIGVYAMTKAAVAGLTRGLARELGARGITINNLEPGPVDTDMNPANGPMAESLTKIIALGRYGKGHELAGLVSYLAGPDGAYVTGSNIKIDGGFSV